jgi:hypothetical protein
MMSVVPLTGSALVEDVSVIVEPEGARRGTFSQEPIKRGNTPMVARRVNRRVIIKPLSIVIP